MGTRILADRLIRVLSALCTSYQRDSISSACRFLGLKGGKHGSDVYEVIAQIVRFLQYL